MRSEFDWNRFTPNMQSSQSFRQSNKVKRAGRSELTFEVKIGFVTQRCGNLWLQIVLSPNYQGESAIVTFLSWAHVSRTERKSKHQKRRRKKHLSLRNGECERRELFVSLFSLARASVRYDRLMWKVEKISRRANFCVRANYSHKISIQWNYKL